MYTLKKQFWKLYFNDACTTKVIWFKNCTQTDEQFNVYHISRMVMKSI